MNGLFSNGEHERARIYHASTYAIYCWIRAYGFMSYCWTNKLLLVQETESHDQANRYTKTIGKVSTSFKWNTLSHNHVFSY